MLFLCSLKTSQKMKQLDLKGEIKMCNLTEIEEMAIGVEMAMDEHGIRYKDGHWMTDEEFLALSDDEIVYWFNLCYGK